MKRMVSVVIPTHKRPDLLERTLASLGDCRRPDGYAYCVVVENGGQQGAEAVVRKAPGWLDVRYRYSAPPNKSAALNLVLDEIDDSLVVFLDDDVRVDPGLLCAYAETMREQPTGLFYGGPMSVDYEEEPSEYVRSYLPPSVRGWSWSGETPIIDEPILMGCNWAANRRDLQQCGGFSLEVGPGGTSGARGQETEMQMRLLKEGFRGLYVPGAMVWHFVPRERCSERWLYRRLYQSAISQILQSPFRGPTLIGIPRWMYRRVVEVGFGWAWAVMKRDKETAFRLRCDYHVLRGWMAGHRYLTTKQVRGRLEDIRATSNASYEAKLQMPSGTSDSDEGHIT